MEENQTTTPQTTKPKKKKTLQNIVLVVTLLVALGLGGFFYYANQKRTQENFQQQAETFSQVTEKVNQLDINYLTKKEGPQTIEEMDEFIKKEKEELEEIKTTLDTLQAVQSNNDNIKGGKLQSTQEKSQEIYSKLEENLKKYQDLAQYSSTGNQASRDLFEVILVYGRVKNLQKQGHPVALQDWYDIFSAINYSTQETITEMKEMKVPSSLENYHEDLTKKFEEIVNISQKFMDHMEEAEYEAADIQVAAFEAKMGEISQLKGTTEKAKPLEENLDNLQKESEELASQLKTLKEELGTTVTITEVKEW